MKVYIKSGCHYSFLLALSAALILTQPYFGESKPAEIVPASDRNENYEQVEVLSQTSISSYTDFEGNQDQGQGSGDEQLISISNETQEYRDQLDNVHVISFVHIEVEVEVPDYEKEGTEGRISNLFEGVQQTDSGMVDDSSANFLQGGSSPFAELNEELRPISYKEGTQPINWLLLLMFTLVPLVLWLRYFFVPKRVVEFKVGSNTIVEGRPRRWLNNAISSTQQLKATIGSGKSHGDKIRLIAPDSCDDTAIVEPETSRDPTNIQKNQNQENEKDDPTLNKAVLSSVHIV